VDSVVSVERHSKRVLQRCGAGDFGPHGPSDVLRPDPFLVWGLTCHLGHFTSTHDARLHGRTAPTGSGRPWIGHIADKSAAETRFGDLRLGVPAASRAEGSGPPRSFREVT